MIRIRPSSLPNQSVEVSLGKHQMIPEVSPQQDRSQWMEEIYVFKEIELAEVVEELERQLDIDIEMDDKHNNTRYNGSFKKGNLGHCTFRSILAIKSAIFH